MCSCKSLRGTLIWASSHSHIALAAPARPAQLDGCPTKAPHSHFHSPLLAYRGKNVHRVKSKSTETYLIIKVYVFHKHPVRLPLATCTFPSTITRMVKALFYTTNIQAIYPWYP